MFSDEKKTINKKIVLIGDAFTGKSSLVYYLARDKPAAADICSTIGANFMRITHDAGPCYVNFELWDTAGNERYRSLSSIYLRNADLVLLVYDGSDPFSYEHLKTYWIDFIHDFYGEEKFRDLPIILVKNKIDKQCDTMPLLQINNNTHYCETSALIGKGIQDVKQKIIELTKSQPLKHSSMTQHDNKYHILENTNTTEKSSKFKLWWCPII